MKPFPFFIIIIFFAFLPIWAQESPQPKTLNSGGFEIGSLELFFASSGEAYFFDSLGGDQTSEHEDDDGNKTTEDYTGRKYKIQYEFQPVYLVSIEGYLKWSFLFIDGLYETDQLYKGGGEIEHSSEVASKLGDSPVYSYGARLGIGLFGLYTSYRSVRFNFGKAKIVDVDRNFLVEESNITLRLEEIDINYRFGERDHFFFGYKQMKYSLPRIVYKLEDTNGDPDNDDYVYVGETKPQMVETRSHMIGGGMKPVELYGSNSFGLIFGGSIYMGGGFTRFEFGPDDSGKVDRKKLFDFSAMPTFQIGFGYNIIDSFIKTSLRIVYEGNVIVSGNMGGSGGDDEDDLGKTMYNYNSADYFHGVSFAVDCIL